MRLRSLVLRPPRTSTRQSVPVHNHPRCDARVAKTGCVDGGRRAFGRYCRTDNICGTLSNRKLKGTLALGGHYVGRRCIYESYQRSRLV
jgi:hypothetical protein